MLITLKAREKGQVGKDQYTINVVVINVVTAHSFSYAPIISLPFNHISFSVFLSVHGFLYLVGVKVSHYVTYELF
jgi:hypothetical protein